MQSSSDGRFCDITLRTSDKRDVSLTVPKLRCDSNDILEEFRGRKVSEHLTERILTL